MNNIPILQNEQKNLERLAAQRELYSAAKRWYIWQMVFTIVVPVLLAVTSLVRNDLAIASAVFGVTSFFADMYFIDNGIKERKEKAAKIQELFDCELLDIPSSPLKTSNDITVEEVLTHYNAHAKISTNIEKIKDWYPKPVGILPLHIDRIICQRANLRWDSALRKRYANFMKYLGAAVLFTILLTSVITEICIANVMLILAGLIPFFQFCIKQHNDNRDSIKRLDELLQFVDQLWKRAIKECASEQTLTLESRRLQDEIFTHRSNNPLILDFIYDRFRANDENIMNVASKRLVEEAMNSDCVELTKQAEDLIKHLLD
jgi:hypothetical protein